jgi:hypothetical protein
MSQVAQTPRFRFCDFDFRRQVFQVRQAHHNFAMNVKLPPLKPFKNLKRFVQIRVVLKAYPRLIGHDFKLLRHALEEAR